MDYPVILDYVPVDRWQALLRGDSLPTETDGAVLFADISGFTPLTEGLARALGPTRGAEELSRQLNLVYDALIAEVNNYRGAVISFSGDAITCWFDQSSSDASGRALQCALKMQEAMAQFAEINLPDGATTILAMKAAVASGRARRFVVGAASIQRIDTLAGNTVIRVAQAEHLAEKGDVIVDAATIERLGERAIVSEQREDHDTHEIFSVITGLTPAVSPLPWDEIDFTDFKEDLIRPYLLPPVYERLQAGIGEFLTELRPGVVFFLRFEGIDYETDPDAGSKLDTFVQQVQNEVRRLDGWLLQLTIGDKGSYLYGVFGTLTAYEDDEFRAASTMLELRRLSLESDVVRPVQIGISRGTVRAGAYGGTTRRTYGALGDEVNLAARLMQAAVPGEVLANERIFAATRKSFQWEVLAPIRVKGKAEPVRVYRLMADSSEQTLYLLEPVYTLPMIGRVTQLNEMLRLFDAASAAIGQIITLTGDAGMGKSRLIAEFIRLTRAKGMVGAGGACQSYGSGMSYLVWTGLLRGLLNVDMNLSPSEREEALAVELTRLDPLLLPRLPLLGMALNFPLTENDFTQNLEPQFRKSALEALILEIVRLRAAELKDIGSALVLIFEDVQWMDGSSKELLTLITQNMTLWNVMIVVAQRPLEPLALDDALAPIAALRLEAFTIAETQQMIEVKIDQLERSIEAITPQIVEQITVRTSGNPFYIEEFLNFLNDRNIELNAETLRQLPPTLQTLILSRIDQLTEKQRVTLKVASIIGRQFRLAQLQGYYPTLGELKQVQDELTYMEDVEITTLDEPEPEIVYLFKHILTHEVTYESLPYATRTTLHEQYASFIETLETDKFLDLIAYHYGRTDNLPKKREYFLKAGEAAATRYANEEAIIYFTRALEVMPQDDLQGRYELLQQREQVYYKTAQREAELHDLDAMEALAQQLTDYRPEVLLRRGIYLKAMNQLEESIDLLTRASERAVPQSELWAESLAERGQTQFFKGDYFQARQQVTDALPSLVAFPRWYALSKRTLGMVSLRQGNLAEAQILYDEAIPLFRQITDRRNEILCIEDLGKIAWFRGDFRSALTQFEAAVQTYRELGYRWGISAALVNLGSVAGAQGDLPASDKYLSEALKLSRQIGNTNNETHALNNLGFNALDQGNYSDAENYFEQGKELAERLQNQSEYATLSHNLGMIAVLQGDFQAAQEHYARSLDLKREMSDTFGQSETLAYQAQLALYLDDPDAALSLAEQAIALAAENEAALEEARATYFRAQALLALGRLDEAREGYETSLAKHRNVEQAQLALESLGGLAAVARANNTPADALPYIEEILSALTERGTAGLQEVGVLYLRCVQGLVALNDPRANEVRDAGRRLIREQQAKITNDTRRKLYVSAIRANRELVGIE